MNTTPTRRKHVSLHGIFSMLCTVVLFFSATQAGAQCTAPSSLTVVQPTNCTTPNGSITIGAPTPLGNYQFSKDDGITFQASNIFTGLAPGTYQLRTKEIATGCVSTRVTQVLNTTAAAITTSLVDNTSCGATANGSITFTAPTTGYTYSKDGGITFQPGATFSSLSAGSYNLVVKQTSTGCTNTALVAINNATVTPATPTSTNTNPTSCTSPNGQISVTSPTPVANFSFSNDGGATFQAGAVFTGLSAGSYSVIAKNNSTGCTSAALSVTLTSPVVSTATTIVTPNTNCTGTPNGAINITGPTPLANFSFSKDNGITFQAGSSFSNLSSATYSVVVKNNASGCTSTPVGVSVTNSFAAPATPTTTVTSPSSCTTPNGQIVVNTPASGVVYSVNAGAAFQAGNTFTGLSGGSYTVVVRSTTTGCVSAFSVATLTNPSVATPTSSVVSNSSCTSVSNGSITVTSPTGANFQYGLNGGTFQSGVTFSNLTDATYSLVARNTTTGCTSAPLSVTVAYNSAGVATPTGGTATSATTCSPPNGSITVGAPTPVSNYNWSIDNGVTWQSSNVFTGLAPGNYAFRAQSISSGCISGISGQVNVASASVANPTVTIINNTNCVGTPNGSITFTTPTGANIQYSINGGNNWQSGTTFSNLSSAQYLAMARNTTTGCVSSIVIYTVLDAPAAVSGPTATLTNATSCSSANGAITITSPTPLANFTFSVDNGVNFQSSASFTGLSAGSYGLVARSNATGCVSGIVPVTLTNTAVATPTANVVANTNCGTTGNGSITITSPLGANLEYSIDGGATYQSSVSFTGLLGSTYSVTARNTSTGCVSALASIAVSNAPAAVTVTASSANPTSCSSPNGTITFSALVGTYQYSIYNGSNLQAGTSFTGLGSGTYNPVAINTTTQCLYSAAPITLTYPVASTPASTVTANTVCAGTYNGAINFTAPTPLANYTFSIDSGVTFQASGSFAGLAPGTYRTMVRLSSTGCNSAVVNQTVATSSVAPTAPTATSVSATSCANPDGSITVTAPIPTGSFSFSKDAGSSFQASNLFSGLTSGNYSLVVKSNATGCSSAATAVTVGGPSVSTPVTSVTSSSSCSAGNGVITITAPSGVGIVFSNNNGSTFQSANVFSGLLAGNYQVIAKNTQTGCVSSTATVSVANTSSQPAAPTATKLDPSSCIAPDGSITITSPAPLSSFQFSIDNGSTFSANTVYTNLSSGTYSLRSRNIATGCISSGFAITLNPPSTPLVVASGTNPSGCTATDGSISFNVSSPASLSSFQYSINSGSTFQNASVFSGLPAGTYLIAVKDIVSGCMVSSLVTPTVVLTSPAVATPTLLANGNSSCTGSPNGYIIITAPQGTNLYQYSIDNGATWQSYNVFTGLSAGTYSILAKNTQTNCISAAAQTYLNNNLPVVNAAPGATAYPNSSCSAPNGQIIVSSPTPLTYYNFSIDNGATWQSSTVFSNLASGSYTVSLKDLASGCKSTSTTAVTVASYPAYPFVSATGTNPTSCASPNGVINFTAPAASTNYLYSINNGINYQSSPTFTNLSAGTYALLTKSVVSGCTGSPSTATMTLSWPAVGTPTATTVAQTSCTSPNGSISVNAPTPLSNYTFSKDGGSTFQTSPNLTGLTAAVYDVVVKVQSSGCTSAIAKINVAAPAAVPGPGSASTNPTTCGGTDGTITIGTPLPLSDYTFSNNNGASFQASPNFTGLSASIYNMVVKRTSTGCVSSSTSVRLKCVETPAVIKSVYKNGGSTTPALVGTNDTINYVIQVVGNNPVSSTFLSEVMSSNQKYIDSSAVADSWSLAGGSAAWFGTYGNGTTTATYSGSLVAAPDGGFIPVYGANTYKAGNTIQTSVTSATFSGAGDGMIPIYWKTDNCVEKVMVKNHHSFNQMKCWNLSQNVNCDADLSALNSPMNYLYTLNSAYTTTVNNKVYTIDLSNGTNGTTANAPQVNCIDLNPSGNPKYCTGYPKPIPGVLGTYVHANPVATNAEVVAFSQYDAANQVLYTAADTANNRTIVYRFNITTGTFSESQPFDNSGFTNALGPNVGATVNNVDRKAVYLGANKLAIERGYGPYAHCIDLSNWPALSDCNPSNTVGVFTVYMGTDPVTAAPPSTVSPLLDPSANTVGFCIQTTCYRFNGVKVATPAGYVPSSYNANYIAYGTKVITLSGYPNAGTAYCYDFATNTSCGSSAAVLSAPYGMEWRVPGKCFLAYGDGGVLTQWGIEPTGLVQNSSLCLLNSCTEFVNTLPDAASRFCGPQPNNIQFRDVLVSNLPQVHSGSTVSIECGGTTLATYTIPTNAAGFAQNISGLINYASCPTPKIHVSIGNPAAGINQVVNTEVTYDNGNRYPEICYDAKLVICNGTPAVNQVTVSGGGTTQVTANTIVASGCVVVNIGGNVFNDVNGLNPTPANTVDGVGTNAGGLNAILIDTVTGNVVATVPVSASGTYNFIDVPGGNYSVMISSQSATVGVPPPAVTLPSGWVNTGENNCVIAPACTGSDGLVNGVLMLGSVLSNITQANFGIEQPPTAGAGTNSLGTNPGGTTQVTIPASTFTNTTSSSDPAPGGVTGIRITGFPANATSIVINGTSYTSATFPAGGVSVPTDASGNPTQSITVDPSFPGSGSVSIPFVSVDAAGKESTNTGNAVGNFTTALAGNVFNDANGLTDNTVNGTGTNAGGLNAILVDGSGNVVATTAVSAGGAYSFTGLTDGTYSVLITTNTGVVSQPAPAVVLPAGWVSTGENNGTAAGNDGTVNSILTPLVLSAPITQANFGIERIPVGSNYTAASQQNPGGTITVPVPAAAFTGIDAEDGTYTTGLSGKKVTLTPGTNGDLYYNGTKLTGPLTISSFNPTLLRIDPTGPNPTGYDSVTSTFSYSIYDAADMPSVAKIITMPFDAALCIKPRVYLEGALMNNNSATAPDGRPLMRDDLRNSPFTGLNYIPVQDPYEFATAYVDVTASYTKLSPQTSSYPAFQSVTDSATVFGVSGQNAIVDWVFVELRNKSNKAQVQATRAALLQRDGDVVETDGVGCLLFPAVPIDSYYVSVRHRSHLGTMTKFAQSSAQLQSLVDFTVTTTPLFDKGVQGPFDFTGLSQKENMVGTYRAMWQGDFNAENKVKYDNPDDDLSIMLFDVVAYPNNSTLATNYDFGYGYRQGDYDMNSKTKFDNPDDDNALELFQVLFYPQNSQFASNFDFMIQQLP